MAEEKELQLEDDESGEGKSKTKLIIIIVVVLLLAIGGGAAFFLLSSDEQTDSSADQQTVDFQEEGSAEDKMPRKPVYVPLDPAFVVSFQVGKRARFLQLRIEILTYNTSVAQGIKQNMPMIRNEIVMLVGNQELAVLRTAKGREELQQMLRKSLNQVLANETGIGGDAIEAVLFTDYVMQ